MARAKGRLSKRSIVCSRGAHYVEQKLAGIAWVASSGSVWRRKWRMTCQELTPSVLESKKPEVRTQSFKWVAFIESICRTLTN